TSGVLVAVLGFALRNIIADIAVQDLDGAVGADPEGEPNLGHNPQLCRANLAAFAGFRLSSRRRAGAIGRPAARGSMGPGDWSRILRERRLSDVAARGPRGGPGSVACNRMGSIR